MSTKKRYQMVLALLIPISFIFSTTTIRGVDVNPFIKPTLTPTATLIPSPTLTPTNTPTPTFTPTPIPTHTPTPTLTPTPEPTLSPTVIPYTSNDFDQWFTQYSKEYGVEKNTLFLIAVCESKLNPQASNGDYKGIYQFSTGTWQSTRNQMGMDQNPDLRFNPEESIRTAAFKISRGGSSAWKNCLP